MNRSPLRSFLALTALLQLTTLAAFSQTSGSLDPSFDGDGINTTYVATTNNNLSPSARAIAVQGDGKVVILVDAHLNTGNTFTNVAVRYNVDGTLDAGFGSAGVVYMNWNGPGNEFGNAYAVGIQNVGTEQKIVVAGSAYSGGLRVERYNANGTLDTTFGTSGRTIVSNGGYALGVAIQPDGKILTTADVGVMVRLNANGTLDGSFGSGGIVQTSINSRANITLQSSGKIIICGVASSGKAVIYVARFNTNGSLDSGGAGDTTPGDSFGTGGKAQVASCSALKVDAADKVLVGGSATQANSTKRVSYSDFAVTRLSPSGQTDTSFGVNGTRAVDISGFSDSLFNVDTQSDGKIVLIGEARTGSDAALNTHAVARLNPDGSVDTLFGQNGRVTVDISSSTEYARSGLVQLDPICNCEKIVVSGTAELSGVDYATVVRLIP